MSAQLAIADDMAPARGFHKRSVDAERMNRTRNEKRAYINETKSAAGCVDCGERDFCVLDFDHVDPTTKCPQLKRRDGVSWVNLGWDTIRAEIEKCVVRCANCHRRKTYYERQVG